MNKTNLVHKEENLDLFDLRIKQAELKSKAIDEGCEQEEAKKNHNFIQLKRPAIKYFRSLMKDNPLAAQIFSFLMEHMDYRNAVVCSSTVLREYFEVSRMSVYRALKCLKESHFLIIGKSGSTNVFIVNPEIVWSSYASAKKFCEFQGTIFMSETENKDLEVKAKKFKEIICSSKLKSE